MRRPGLTQHFLSNNTFPLASAFEVGTCTYTCLAMALRLAGLVCWLSSLSDSTARFFELVVAEGTDFGESSMSISLVGVVGIDGLLKREASAVEGVSDWEGERNLPLLRGGMRTKATRRRRAVKGMVKGRNENGASRSLVGNQQGQTTATDASVSHSALFPD